MISALTKVAALVLVIVCVAPSVVENRLWLSVNEVGQATRYTRGSVFQGIGLRPHCEAPRAVYYNDVVDDVYTYSPFWVWEPLTVTQRDELQAIVTARSEQLDQQSMPVERLAARLDVFAGNFEQAATRLQSLDALWQCADELQASQYYFNNELADAYYGAAEVTTAQSIYARNQYRGRESLMTPPPVSQFEYLRDDCGVEVSAEDRNSLAALNWSAKYRMHLEQLYQRVDCPLSTTVSSKFAPWLHLEAATIESDVAYIEHLLTSGIWQENDLVAFLQYMLWQFDYASFVEASRVRRAEWGAADFASTPARASIQAYMDALSSPTFLAAEAASLNQEFLWRQQPISEVDKQADLVTKSAVGIEFDSWQSHRQALGLFTAYRPALDAEAAPEQVAWIFGPERHGPLSGSVSYRAECVGHGVGETQSLALTISQPGGTAWIEKQPAQTIVASFELKTAGPVQLNARFIARDASLAGSQSAVLFHEETNRYNIHYRSDAQEEATLQFETVGCGTIWLDAISIIVEPA